MKDEGPQQLLEKKRNFNLFLVGFPLVLPHHRVVHPDGDENQMLTLL